MGCRSTAKVLDHGEGRRPSAPVVREGPGPRGRRHCGHGIDAAAALVVGRGIDGGPRTGDADRAPPVRWAGAADGATTGRAAPKRAAAKKTAAAKTGATKTRQEDRAKKTAAAKTGAKKTAAKKTAAKKTAAKKTAAKRLRAKKTAAKKTSRAKTGSA